MTQVYLMMQKKERWTDRDRCDRYIAYRFREHDKENNIKY